MKKIFYLLTSLFILFSCSSKQPKQIENEDNTVTDKTLSVADSIVAVEAQVPESTVITDTLPTSLPPKTIKQQMPKITPITNKNKVDKEAPALPQKRNSALAKENTPQKIIGNEYFEVVEGCYCNDNWSGNPYYVGCTNCRFCREIMVRVISEDTIYFKQVWAGGYVKNITAQTGKGGKIGLYSCIGYGPEYHKSPPPIPYQGQALISYSVGDANGKICYFDVTNLIKWCGRFYTYKRPTPKGNGPYK